MTNAERLPQGDVEVTNLPSTSSLCPKGITPRRRAGPHHQSSQSLQGSQCSCDQQSLLMKKTQVWTISGELCGPKRRPAEPKVGGGTEKYVS